MKRQWVGRYRVVTPDNTLANLRSGFRLIRKAPMFSVAVILTLALGIGANSAVFSAISAILLRPLPFPESDELVLIGQYDRTARNSGALVAPLRLEDWNRLSAAFQAISGWYVQDASEVSGTLPEKVTMALAAPRFLQVWGVSPSLGRDFAPAEEHFGGPRAVLISDRFWRRRFNADPNVIGKSLRTEKRAYTIVGIMPAAFRFPVKDVDLWTPSPPDAPYAQDRDSTWFTAVGRLKPGVTLTQARDDLARVQHHLGLEFPKSDAKLGVQLQLLKENTIGTTGHGLWILFGSVSLLLVIASTNIAALLLARTTAREREIGVRFSLGASRWSVIVQLLTECFVLVLAGSALGLFIAGAAAKAFRVFAKNLPRTDEITLDWRILLYALLCSVIVTFLCGLFPAIRSTRRSLAEELAHNSRTQVSTRNPLQWVLVGVQISLAVSLLVGAGLLLRSFEELGHVSPGFDESHILTLRVSASWADIEDKHFTQKMNGTLDELRATPGIRGAATSLFLPGVPGDARAEVKLSERQSDAADRIVADARWVSNGYFETMRIPILAGESCREATNFTAVVNRSFANGYLSGSSGLGLHLENPSNRWHDPPAQIRGIAADAREQGLNRAPAPTIYFCVSAPTPTPWFLVRTEGNPMAMAGTLRNKIHQIEPARSVFDISPLEEHLSDNFAQDRMRTMLMTFFAVTAILLACIGLYGTLSYFISLRRRELALRLALGAPRGQIGMHFLLKGLGVSLAGCAAGLCFAAGLTRSLSGMLYGVSTGDAETWISVVLLVLAVAALASLLPGIRAAYLEPMKVLRDE